MVILTVSRTVDGRSKRVVRVRPAMRVGLRVSLILQSALQEGEVKG